MLVDWFDSYRPIFILAAVCHAIGALLLQQVKEGPAHAEAGAAFGTAD
jgi:hypothetical protein